MNKKGFTLIELLIVVAIIAILAAIAVPNFIEAQIRSKLSRTLADMRSCAVAIQSYTVDNNIWVVPAYSPTNMDRSAYCDYSNTWAPGGDFSTYLTCPQNVYNGGCGFMLTTPISYMASMPIDPFLSAVNGDQYGYVYCGIIDVGEESSAIGEGWDGFSSPIYAHWWLYTMGPSMFLTGGTPYDPSNGTTSVGVVWYFDSHGFFGNGNH